MIFLYKYVIIFNMETQVNQLAVIFAYVAFNSEKAVCDRSKVLKFQEGYPYIDIFINREYSAQSVVNNSEILRKDASIPLERQLDAILIWDIKNGFIEENEVFFVQEVLKKQVFHPSFIPQFDPLVNFIAIVDNCKDISSEQKIYLLEAIKCYESECYLGFISMLGTFYEDLLINLCIKYKRRISSAFPSVLKRYETDVLKCRKAKKRLDGLINFIKSLNKEEVYFKQHGIESLNDIDLSFDVIRKYRNDIDHPTGKIVNSGDCSALIQIFVSYVRSFYDIMKTF